jgi:phage I-like protein
VQHESFWAEDLIYTSAAAIVRTKAEILATMRAAAAKPAAAHPAAHYAAEDVVVRVYGEFAALTFRLVAQNPDGSVDTYRNSGAFVRRDGRWQAVTWQATKLPAAGKK